MNYREAKDIAVLRNIDKYYAFKCLKMNNQKQTSNELIELQEDIASHFTQEHFPLSGEVYWTMVECIAIAKLAQLRGEVS